MRIDHAVYCRTCSSKILKNWKGWPHRDPVPILPRIYEVKCEECGNADILEPSEIKWFNYHNEFSTGLPDYWLLIVHKGSNQWGLPYYGESICNKCYGRSIISQMKYPNGKSEMCWNCVNCRLVRKIKK